MRCSRLGQYLLLQPQWLALVAGCSLGHEAKDAHNRAEDAHDGDEDARNGTEDACSRQHEHAAVHRDEQEEHPIKAKQPCPVSTPFFFRKREKTTK